MNLGIVREWFYSWSKDINWWDSLLYCAIFLSFTWTALSPIPIFILLGTLFFKRTKSNNWQFIFNWKNPFFWSICFFLFHIVGLLWTSNFKYAFSDFGFKMYFLIVPLIFCFTPFSFSSTKFISKICDGVTFIVIALLLFAVWQSWCYSENNHWGYFFESEYSVFLHRSYWATYTAFFSAIVLYDLLQQKYQNKAWKTASYLLLSLSTFLTISKAGIIIWLVLTIVILIKWLLTKKKKSILIAISIFITIVISFISLTNNRVKARFISIPNALSELQLSNNNTVESSAARLIMWSTASKIIQHHWIIGVGTGDVKDALIQKNIELGNWGVAKEKLNAHNQFLNTWVQLGVVGLLCLLMMFFTTLKKAGNTPLIYRLIFVFTFMTTMLFESFIETQGGIIPFCLLLGILNYEAVDFKTIKV